jgi:hypothetical protein
MTGLAERSVAVVESRLSRRGFLATCGKLTLGLGMAMLGLAYGTRSALAACCPGISCDSAHSHPCPPGGAGCPTGCSQGNPTQCCDVGGFWHICWPCICNGASCHCEEPTGEPC